MVNKGVNDKSPSIPVQSPSCSWVGVGVWVRVRSVRRCAASYACQLDRFTVHRGGTPPTDTQPCFAQTLILHGRRNFIQVDSRGGSAESCSSLLTPKLEPKVAPKINQRLPAPPTSHQIYRWESFNKWRSLDLDMIFCRIGIVTPAWRIANNEKQTQNQFVFHIFRWASMTTLSAWSTYPRASSLWKF